MTEFHVSYIFDADCYRTLIRAREERRGSRRWRRYAAVALIYLVALAATVWWDGTLGEMPSWTAGGWIEASRIVLIGIVALLAFVAAVDIVLDRVVYPYIFRRYSQAGKTIAISIAETGLRWKSDSIEGSMEWSAIQNVTTLRDKSAAVLWLGKMEGVLLPSRSFAPGQSLEAAVAFIKGKLRVAP